MKFSDRYVQSLKAQAKRYTIFEDNTHRSGTLGLRVSPAGSKMWVHFYVVEGRRRMVTLGRYPAMTVAEAHAAHADAALALQHGTDPVPAPVDEPKVQPETVTVAELVEGFVAWQRDRKKKKTWAEDERQLRHDALPVLGGHRVVDVSRGDIRRLLEAVVDRGAPVAANRLFAVVRRMFKYAILQELIEYSPCYALETPTQEASRERYLDEDELRRFFAALPTAAMWPPTQLALLFVLLTVKRSGEVVHALWSEFDADHTSWTIPREKAKNAQTDTVLLSPQARMVLDAIARHDVGSGVVFPSIRGGEPMAQTALARAVARNRDHFGLPHFTPHDLRRTAATGLARQGTDDKVLSKLLNHKVGGATPTYNRHAYQDEKLEALEKWGARLAELGLEEAIERVAAKVGWQTDGVWWERREARIAGASSAAVAKSGPSRQAAARDGGAARKAPRSEARVVRRPGGRSRPGGTARRPGD